MHFESDAILPVELFIEAFVASLVQKGWTSFCLRDTRTTKGLAAVVDIFDSAIDNFETRDVSWKEIVPWVRITNTLRLSPMHGTEGWEHQFKSAQGYSTRFSITYPGIVELQTPKATADFKLDMLQASQKALVDTCIQRFTFEVQN